MFIQIIDLLTLQKSQILIDQLQSLFRMKEADNSIPKTSYSLENYKKKLLTQVVVIFVICLILILERVFYQIIIDQEQKGISQLQIDTELIEQDHEGNYIAKDITNGFLQFFDLLSEFSIQFLLLTHFLATLYVSGDALLATKVSYVSFGLIYIVSVVQMLYTGGRPFWSQKSILSSRCLPSYNHPSIGLLLLLFVPIYTYFCWKKSHKIVPSNKPIIALISLLVIASSIQFVNFLTGTIYLTNIFMTIVFGLVFYVIVGACNQFIDMAIKKSTIFHTEARKYVFYWLLFISVLAAGVLIVFTGEDLFLDIQWVENYMQCTRYLNYSQKTYRYDQIIGPWFNFAQTSTLFGWIGAVFGVSRSFRIVKNINWAGGPLKQRIIRGAITNILIIPSWIFILLLQDRGKWVKDIGLNTYIVNSLHFFILYLWIFGFVPVILYKYLKLTNTDEDDFYRVINEEEMK